MCKERREYMLFIVIILIASAIFCLAYTFIFSSQNKIIAWQKKKEEKLISQLDELYLNKKPAEILRFYFILPLAFGVISFFLFRSFLFIVVGASLGLFIPNFILKAKDKQRRYKFNEQIPDMIGVLNSSLKGGLSLQQALEIVVEESSFPMSHEIGLLIRQVKMGVLLEEALIQLSSRISSPDWTLVVNSILVAKETGGDLTRVLSRLVTTIRDNRKLRDNIKTLTLQGKLQGIIMSCLPFAFVGWVSSFNRAHFDIMLNSDIGRMFLLAAIVLQIIGMILIKKFSTIKF
ncbi:MAG: type II secretion system F family protein [Candidatus Omnitrophota bacterium]|nr:type II secretion system F family protein [Candidatus Omnitrophota bacterium]